MPYSSTKDLPSQTDKLSPKRKRQFKAAFNAAYEKYGEERAFKIAWAAVNKAHVGPTTSMIALLPSDPKSLPMAKGELAHVTMCFLGEGGIPERAGEHVRRAARYLPIRAKVAGVGQLGQENPPATVLILNGEGIREARAVSQVPGCAEQFEPFVAHLTLGYGVPLSRGRKLMGTEILLDRVALVQSNEIITEVGVKDITKGDSYAGAMDLRLDKITKTDDDLRQGFGWASVVHKDGEPVVDLQGDVIDIEELEKAAYDYVLDSRVGGVMHQRVGKAAPKQVGTMIESMVFTPEKIEKLGLPDDTPHGWWIGFQIDDEEVWKGIKEDKYPMFSIHGKGHRKAYEPDEEDLGKYVGWVASVAKTLDEDPDDIEAELRKVLDASGFEPTDDNLVGYVATIVDEIGVEKSLEQISKHLIGNHDQKDHDPKKKGTHTRSQHGTSKDPSRVAGANRALRGAGALTIPGFAPFLAASAIRGTTVFSAKKKKKVSKASPDQSDVSVQDEKKLSDREKRVLARHFAVQGTEDKEGE